MNVRCRLGFHDWHQIPATWGLRRGATAVSCSRCQEMRWLV